MCKMLLFIVVLLLCMHEVLLMLTLYLYAGSVDVIVTGSSPKVGGVETACVFNVTNHLHLVEEPGTGLYQSSHVQLQSRVRLVKMK